jgi:hypothetical protein
LSYSKVDETGVAGTGQINPMPDDGLTLEMRSGFENTPIGVRLP